MESHAKKCVERRCELVNKTTEQSYKVATPCMDDHQSEEETNGSVGELSTVCPQNVVKCIYLARTGRPDILWSVNKLARAITKWTKSCDKSLARLIFSIHQTCEYRQYFCVEQHNTADQDCFKTLILQETWKTRSQHQEEFYAFSEAKRSCQLVGCARNRLQFHTIQQKLK